MKEMQRQGRADRQTDEQTDRQMNRQIHGQSFYVDLPEQKERNFELRLLCLPRNPSPLDEPNCVQALSTILAVRITASSPVSANLSIYLGDTTQTIYKLSNTHKLLESKSNNCYKISKILNFRNSNLKTCSMPTKYSQFQVYMVKCL